MAPNGLDEAITVEEPSGIFCSKRANPIYYNNSFREKPFLTLIDRQRI